MNKRAVRNIVEQHKIDTPFICTPIQCWHNHYYGSIVAGLNLFLHKHAVSFLCPIFSPCCNILLASGCHEFEMPCWSVKLCKTLTVLMRVACLETNRSMWQMWTVCTFVFTILCLKVIVLRIQRDLFSVLFSKFYITCDSWLGSSSQTWHADDVLDYGPLKNYTNWILLTSLSTINTSFTTKIFNRFFCLKFNGTQSQGWAAWEHIFNSSWLAIVKVRSM